MEAIQYSQIPVIVLCGGRGTRMHSETKDELPKHLLEINGKTILDYSLEPFMNSERIIMAVSNHSQKIIDHYNTNDNRKIEFVVEDTPAGVVGAIINAVELADIKDVLMVSRGDEVVSGLDLSKMYEFHKTGNFLATLALSSNVEEIDYVFEFDEASTAMSFIRSSGEPKKGIYCGTGVFILEPQSIDTLRESHNWEDFLERLITYRSLGCFATECAFFNVNSPSELSSFRQCISQNSIMF